MKISTISGVVLSIFFCFYAVWSQNNKTNEKENLDKQRVQYSQSLEIIRKSIEDTDRLLKKSRFKQKMYEEESRNLHERHKKAQQVLRGLMNKQLKNAKDIEIVAQLGEEAKLRALYAATDLLISSVGGKLLDKISKVAADRERLTKMADTVLKKYTNKKMLSTYSKIFQSHSNSLKKFEALLFSIHSLSAYKSQSDYQKAFDNGKYNKPSEVLKLVKEKVTSLGESFKAAQDGLKLIATIKNNRSLLDASRHPVILNFLKEYKKITNFFKIADLMFFTDAYLSAAVDFGESWMEVNRLSKEININSIAMTRISEMIKENVEKEKKAISNKDAIIKAIEKLNYKRKINSERLAWIEKRIAEIDALLATMK